MAYGKFKQISYKVSDTHVDRDAVGFETTGEVSHPWIAKIDMNLLAALCEFELDLEESE